MAHESSTNPLFQVTHTRVLNPKCISMGELYGEFNDLTQEWHDGLASMLIREAVGEENNGTLINIYDRICFEKCNSI